MEITKELLESIGFEYKSLNDGHWLEATKGCIRIIYPDWNKGWVILIEWDHDYSEMSSNLSFEDIVELDKILNKTQ